jgi:hypothetical protein
MNRDESPRKIGAGIIFGAFLSKTENSLVFLQALYPKCYKNNDYLVHFKQPDMAALCILICDVWCKKIKKTSKNVLKVEITFYIW